MGLGDWVYGWLAVGLSALVRVVYVLMLAWIRLGDLRARGRPDTDHTTHTPAAATRQQNRRLDPPRKESQNGGENQELVDGDRRGGAADTHTGRGDRPDHNREQPVGGDEAVELSAGARALLATLGAAPAVKSAWLGERGLLMAWRFICDAAFWNNIYPAADELTPPQVLPRTQPDPDGYAAGVGVRWFAGEGVDISPGARTILYLHGGGFTAGSSASMRSFTAGLSRATRTRVVSVDYRLAPEHPLPAGTNDGLAVYRWL